MLTGIEFATDALLSKWDRYTYNVLDCQGFVEAVLKDIGVRKPDGSVYNWRGCNSMYRNYYSWRGTVEECVNKFGYVPVGAFVYIWKPTGEEDVGYKDGLGNCTHVGIYCGNNVVARMIYSYSNFHWLNTLHIIGNAINSKGVINLESSAFRPHLHNILELLPAVGSLILYLCACWYIEDRPVLTIKYCIKSCRRNIKWFFYIRMYCC